MTVRQLLLLGVKDRQIVFYWFPSLKGAVANVKTGGGAVLVVEAHGGWKNGDMANTYSPFLHSNEIFTCTN